MFQQQQMQGPGYTPQMNPNLGLANMPVIIQAPNECTLYVGNLNPLIDESRLIEIFRPYGTLQSTKIMRDAFNSESRRFGFVSFTTNEEAIKAKSELNYKVFDNFEIRICLKKVNSEFKEGANLFVKNLDSSVTTKKLDDLFSEHGKTVSCSIRTNNSGESLGYGYVQYETEENAQIAIEKLNNSTTFGSPISVQKFVSSKNREVQKNNVYLRNFPKSWEKAKIVEWLKDMAAKFGKTTSSEAYGKKFSDNTTSCYAFVAFENQDEANAFIAEFNDKQLDEKAEGDLPLLVTIAESKQVRQIRLKKEHANNRNTTNLLVKSLLDSVTQEKISEVFSKYGEITSIGLKTCQPNFLPNGQTLQSAYINFKTADQATNVLLNAKKDADVKALIHPIHKKTIEFITYFQNRSIRNEYLRMKQRMFQTMNFGAMQMPMPGAFPGNFKKQGFGSMMPPMPMPFAMQGPFRNGPNMKFQPMPVSTPPTAKHSTSGATSRQGDDEEAFSLEYLKTHTENFKNFDKDRQNEILGNLMYHKVMESGLGNKELAPKITGMLIDTEILEIAEIIEIMENKESLNERINEALEVINSTED